MHAHLAELERRNYSPGTIEQRRRALARLARFGGHPPSTATAELIVALLARRQRDGMRLKPATQVAELAHLRSFFRWLQINDHRTDDPTLKVPRPRVPRYLPRPISEPDLFHALDNAPTRIRPWLYLAAFAGLRACEISPLKAEHLLRGADPPLIFIERMKGGDSGTVPLAPVIADALAGLPRKGWLFLRHDGEPGPLRPHNVSHGANDYLHRLGLLDTLHSLRHRFGTQVYRASGHDLRQTQELMRHRSVVSTAIYTQVDQAEAAGIVNALPFATGRRPRIVAGSTGLYVTSEAS